MNRVPALDGLRAFAVVGVVLAHCRTPIVGGGRGVDVFFVLSGYLITSILLKEPPLAGFYIRRARRLLPALVLFLAAYLIAAPIIFPRDQWWREAGAALFYSYNWSMAFHFRESGLAHLWSLSVEEQFYLVWPPIVIMGLRRTTIPLIWLGVAWFAFTVGRTIWPDPSAAYYIVPLHATGLIVGAMVALKRPSDRYGWPAVGVIVLVFMFGGSWRGAWDIPLTEIGSAFLISALHHPSRLTSAFAWKPFAWIGLVSYGIYLWHWPIAYLTRDNWWSAPLTLLTSISLAALSYYLVERRLGRSGRAEGADEHRSRRLRHPSEPVLIAARQER